MLLGVQRCFNPTAAPEDGCDIHHGAAAGGATWGPVVSILSRPRRTAATGRRPAHAAETPAFQSSAAPEDGCDRCRQAVQLVSWEFQSPAAPEDGCDLGRGRRRPTAKLPCFNPTPPRRTAATPGLSQFFEAP